MQKMKWFRSGRVQSFILIGGSEGVGSGHVCSVGRAKNRIHVLLWIVSTKTRSWRRVLTVVVYFDFTALFNSRNPHILFTL